MSLSLKCNEQILGSPSVLKFYLLAYRKLPVSFAEIYRNWAICYVIMPSMSKADHCADRSILALLSAYQEYLVTFKLLTSQVVQREEPRLAYTTLGVKELRPGEERLKAEEMKMANITWNTAKMAPNRGHWRSTVDTLCYT